MRFEYQWLADGIRSKWPPRRLVETAKLPWLMKQLKRNKAVSYPDLAKLPAEAGELRRYLLEDQMTSYCSVAIGRGTQVLGFLSLSSCHLERARHPDIVSSLRSAGAAFANLLFRHHAHWSLEESKDRFRAFFEQAAVGVVIMGLDLELMMCNPAFCRFLGRPLADLKLRQIVDLVHSDDQQQMEALLEKLRDTLDGSASLKVRFLRPDDKVIWGNASFSVLRDNEGTQTAFLGVILDITEAHLTQEQLQQSQKMEAIGRLAGGVAHDFNNMLVAILGYADMAAAEVDDSVKLKSHLEQIVLAAERSEALTRQLLTFSRRQAVLPRVINLNDVVMDMEKMLRRLIGEHIEFGITLESKIHLIEADVGQLEQVLMNLVVNARDAMPEGGRLRVETANTWLTREHKSFLPDLRPGHFACLIVADTGVGMDPATREKIFEPFFTTKQSSGGTGLGLSTVYGIVKRAGGHVFVYSEVGRGTSFKVYLPRTSEGPVDVIFSEPNHQQDLRGDETVLVAEDEQITREMLTLVLRDKGYNVIAAADGNDALALAESYEGEIAVLVTDVVMPGLGGKDLATRLFAVRPKIRVLFSSGYSGDAMIRADELQTGMAFLPKPFSSLELLGKVRELLDS